MLLAGVPVDATNLAPRWVHMDRVSGRLAAVETRGRSAVDVGWTVYAACRGADPELFFLRDAQQRRAKKICLHCPVRLACLAEALEHRIEFGVWGGMTERERRAVIRRLPSGPPQPLAM